MKLFILRCRAKAFVCSTLDEPFAELGVVILSRADKRRHSIGCPRVYIRAVFYKKPYNVHISGERGVMNRHEDRIVAARDASARLKLNSWTLLKLAKIKYF